MPAVWTRCSRVKGDYFRFGSEQSEDVVRGQAGRDDPDGLTLVCREAVLTKYRVGLKHDAFDDEDFWPDLVDGYVGRA